MAYDNNNKGVLFKNDKKGNEKAPDYKGVGNFDGKDFKIAVWLRESGKGTKYMSLSFQADEKKPDQQAKSAPAKDESEIPF
jgi:uncharacterized protein (DUF736 family)